ncbi:hypothetical protein EKN56_18820 [Limnobaculum zhutongyuii]|uniref:Uncharacterized protein n=1 Tax=Limnobaculum zhutongyuii TaxID=2498113 RepID=A0A411WPW6_9GAMM|nr:hypothetical protein [Limnobaculum zhutongyuii]QBH98261.1 hypothetical protein EKN56_18820 [Limnobaculum zhutongyuii]TQS89843.1 hypothetical protein ELQ32_05420 [Limnobaculum zhutongyuii]
MTGGAQIDWRDVVFAPLWMRHIIMISVCMLVGGLGWYLLMIPLTEVNQQFQMQLEKAEQQGMLYQQQLLSLPDKEQLKTQIEQVKGKLQPYQYQSDNGAGFIRTIAEYLSTSGCQLIDIGSPLVSQQGVLTLYDWQLKVSADYFQFIELIQLLNSGTGLTTISRLTLDGGPRLTINMTVRLYRLNQGTL